MRRGRVVPTTLAARRGKAMMTSILGWILLAALGFAGLVVIVAGVMLHDMDKHDDDE